MKEARRAMGEMKREQEKPEHIESGNKVILKSVNHHRVNVVMAVRIELEQIKAAIGFAECEMEEVIDDKREDDQAAHDHVTRGEAGFDVFLVDVRLRPGAAIFNGELNSKINVKHDGADKKDADKPEQGAEIAQMLGVGIDPVGPEENLQVTQEVADDKQDQNNPGERHDHLLSDRRMTKGGDESATGRRDLDLRLRG